MKQKTTNPENFDDCTITANNFKPMKTEDCINCGRETCALAGIGNKAGINENNGCFVKKTTEDKLKDEGFRKWLQDYSNFDGNGLQRYNLPWARIYEIIQEVQQQKRDEDIKIIENFDFVKFVHLGIYGSVFNGYSKEEKEAAKIIQDNLLGKLKGEK